MLLGKGMGCAFKPFAGKCLRVCRRDAGVGVNTNLGQTLNAQSSRENPRDKFRGGGVPSIESVR